ncbi:hypothetical protein HMPREF9713_03121 [Myroides odoratimimus CCUG 12700]|nr:hypothetical protein HMPREF9713_03121 [Myroides odoratimimus CCUG 12700]
MILGFETSSKNYCLKSGIGFCNESSDTIVSQTIERQYFLKKGVEICKVQK